MSPLGLAGIISGGQLLSNTLGNIFQNRQNRELAQQGQEFEKQMWSKTNEYNSPEQQMIRLKAAGLNPNLVYGTGNVSGQTSSPAPRAHVATVKNVMEGAQPINSLSMLSQYQDIKNKQITNDNIRANTELTEQRKITEQMRPYLMQLEGAQKRLNYSQAEKLAPYQVSLAATNLKKIQLQNNQALWQYENLNPLQKMKIENDLKQQVLTRQLGNQRLKYGEQQISSIKLDQAIRDLEYQISKGLSPYGLQAKDNVFVRQGARLIEGVKQGLKNPSFGRGIWKSRYYNPNLQY